MENLRRLVDFFSEISALKRHLRYGQEKSPLSESVADHSWRLGVMSFFVAKEMNLDLDTEKIIKLSLIHDLGEYLGGDVDYRNVSNGKISREEKERMEKMSFGKLLCFLPQKSRSEFEALWSEYEKCETPESRYIKALDKIETTLHISEHDFSCYDAPEITPNYSDKSVGNFPALKPLLGIVKQKLKKEYEKGKIPWKKEYGL